MTQALKRVGSRLRARGTESAFDPGKDRERVHMIERESNERDTGVPVLAVYASSTTSGSSQRFKPVQVSQSSSSVTVSRCQLALINVA